MAEYDQPESLQGNMILGATDAGGANSLLRGHRGSLTNIVASLQGCAPQFQNRPASNGFINDMSWLALGGWCDRLSMFNTVQTPNSLGINGCRIAARLIATAVAPSPVPRTVTTRRRRQLTFADGSVERLSKDSISMTTWWALGTRARGEVLSSDSY